MRPVHDIDALLLLATALSSKRRPAELIEIVAAAELLQGEMPSESKLVEAFHRLSAHGLICEIDGRYALAPDAQKMISGGPRKAEIAERVFGVRDKLSAYQASGEHPAIALGEEEMGAAVVAHQTAVKEAKATLLVPKPKVTEESGGRTGLRQRKPLPARRRKS